MLISAVLQSDSVTYVERKSKKDYIWVNRVKQKNSWWVGRNPAITPGSIISPTRIVILTISTEVKNLREPWGQRCQQMLLLSSAVGGTHNTAIYKSHVLNVLKLQRKIISQALGSKGKIWGHRGEARFRSVRLLEYRILGYLLQLKIILLKCSLYVKPPQIAILPFCISFSWGWSWSLPPVQCHKPLPIVHQALYQI